jgi:hypothetical protein
MPNLSELNGTFLHRADGRIRGLAVRAAEANGLSFRCPACRKVVVVWWGGDGTHGSTAHFTVHPELADASLANPVKCQCGWDGRVADGTVESLIR